MLTTQPTSKAHSKKHNRDEPRKTTRGPGDTAAVQPQIGPKETTTNNFLFESTLVPNLRRVLRCLYRTAAAAPLGLPQPKISFSYRRRKGDKRLINCLIDNGPRGYSLDEKPDVWRDLQEFVQEMRVDFVHPVQSALYLECQEEIDWRLREQQVTKNECDPGGGWLKIER